MKVIWFIHRVFTRNWYEIENSELHKNVIYSDELYMQKPMGFHVVLFKCTSNIQTVPYFLHLGSLFHPLWIRRFNLAKSNAFKDFSLHSDLLKKCCFLLIYIRFSANVERGITFFMCYTQESVKFQYYQRISLPHNLLSQLVL